MRIFKWEKLKKDAVYHIGSMRRDNKAISYALLAGTMDGSKWRDNLAEMENQAESIINAWDVRQCMKLVAAFPDILPKIYRDKHPSLDVNDKGEWVLIFDALVTR